MPNPLRALPLLALALAPLQGLAQAAVPPAQSITVTGEGRSDQKPDMAVASLGVSEQAGTAGQAMTLMGSGMAAVLGALAEAGIAPADVQTGQFYLEPNFNYDSGATYPPVTGFIATQTVEVRVRELPRLGAILDAATKMGANRIDGVTFVLADQAAAREEARASAVADARERAAFYAEAAGVALGALVSIGEIGVYSGPSPMYDGRLAAEASTPVAAGTVTTTASVTMTFAIE